MKKITSLFAMFVFSTLLVVAQTDQPATSTDNKKPSQADKAAANDVAAPRSDPDFGWIGLLGLAGLAGLRRRREVHEVRPEGTFQENLRRAS